MNDSPRIGLVTFGGGHRRIRAAARRVGRQGRRSGRFTTIQVFTDKTLKRKHKDFWRQHSEFLAPSVRGFGYWIWKPYVINFALKSSINEVDYVFYIDGGCEINHVPASQDRWNDYLDLLASDTGRLVMQQTYVEEQWQKMDAVVALELSSEDLKSGQMQAGVVAFRVNDDNIAFTQKWLDLCVTDDYHLVDDSPSRLENIPSFIEHRHDQSVLSALIKQNGAAVIPAETNWAPDWKVAGETFPVWTTGNKTGVSIVDTSIVAALRRFTGRIRAKIDFELAKKTRHRSK
jgi:hypothetical protein